MTNLHDWGLPPLIHNIPEDLASLPRWVCWKAAQRGQKVTKIPIDPVEPTQLASTKEPSTWGTLEDAYQTYQTQEDINGIGFVITDLTGYVFVDLDNVRDPETGSIDPWAQNVATDLESFTEISPSGTGLHIISKGTLPGPDFINHEIGIEMYGGNRARYLTITGHLPEETKQTEIS
ncbi:MAG: hypothetical protein ACWA5Q_05575 [bacterium]